MKRSAILLWLTAFIALYHILVVGKFLTWLGIFIPEQVHRSISLASALLLVFVLFRAGKTHGEEPIQSSESGESLPESKVPWYDFLLIGALLSGAGYVVFFYDEILRYSTFGFLDEPGMVLALLLAVPLLEASRRIGGWSLLVIILLFVFAALFQKYLPGILHGQGYALDRLLYSAYVGTSGIFGLPLYVASTIIIVFMIYGALLQKAGAGKWFLDLALSLTGWSYGGPAKAAVVSSAFFGMISGSPSGNAATIGIFTIPLMKRIGYSPAYAAAVEACASTGGQILPPVMGAIAFVMAEWIGVPYAEVALAAAVPAILYFLILFASVHFQAHKDGIRPIPRKELPGFRAVVVQGWFYLIPILALAYFLIIQRLDPAMACIYSFPFLIGSSFLSKDKSCWLTPKNIASSFASAVKGWVGIAAITGAVGIMVGALELSGLGIKFSRFTLDLSGGDLLLTLIFVGIASLILGTALDSIPAYVILASLMAPALVQIGVPELAAHLFVVYWGLASFITPPVALSVFVACGISGSKMWETGWLAMRIGIAVYLVPFAFVLHPGLLLKGTIEELVVDIAIAVIGSVLLASGISGYAVRKMNIWERIFISLAGVLLIAPGLVMPVIGIGIALVILLWQWYEKYEKKGSSSFSTDTKAL
ncbi:TRAP transporter permease [Bacillaceae bacterium]